MDNRAIGVFDSGIGGLTSVMHLMEQLPNERVVFYGDTARTPYGSKSPETIMQFSRQIIEFLLSNDVKMILIACNTVSASCLLKLSQIYTQVPIIGVIEPTLQAVTGRLKSGQRVGVIATKVTINSGIYERKIREKRSDLIVFSKACPVFVPLIEEGIIKSQIMDLTIRHYLDDFISKNNIDTLILGCTHYPLIAQNLKKLYPNLELVSSSFEIVNRVKEELEMIDGFSVKNDVKSRFYASDLSENFINMIDFILGKKRGSIEFKNLDI